MEADLGFMDKVSAKSGFGKDSANSKSGSVIMNSSGSTILSKVKSSIPQPRNAKQEHHHISKNSSSSNLSLNKDNENNGDKGSRMERTPHLDAVREERDYYFSKLKDIDHLLDVHREGTTENLMNKIREIL